MMELSINNADDLIAFINILNGQHGYLYSDEIFSSQAFKLIQKFYNNYSTKNVWALNLYDDYITLVETMENTIEIPWSEIKWSQENFIKYVLDYAYFQYNDFRTCARKETTQKK